MDVEHKVISTTTNTKGIKLKTKVITRRSERRLQLIEIGDQ